MNKASAHFCLWYACPKCNNENIYPQPISNPYLTCHKCSHIIPVGEIAYTTLKRNEAGEFSCNTATVCFGAVQFTCTCGKKNLIIPKIETFKPMTNDDFPWKQAGLNLVVGGTEPDGSQHEFLLRYEMPKYGLCEECMLEYEIDYSAFVMN